MLFFMNIGFDSYAVSIKVCYLHYNFLKICTLGSIHILVLVDIFCWLGQANWKLDGVVPIDNRPSTD